METIVSYPKKAFNNDLVIRYLDKVVVKDYGYEVAFRFHYHKRNIISFNGSSHVCHKIAIIPHRTVISD